jgi:hypothetical protein
VRHSLRHLRYCLSFSPLCCLSRPDLRRLSFQRFVGFSKGDRSSQFYFASPRLPILFRVIFIIMITSLAILSRSSQIWTSAIPLRRLPTSIITESSKRGAPAKIWEMWTHDYTAGHIWLSLPAKMQVSGVPRSIPSICSLEIACCCRAS